MYRSFSLQIDDVILYQYSARTVHTTHKKLIKRYVCSTQRAKSLYTIAR